MKMENNSILKLIKLEKRQKTIKLIECNELNNDIIFVKFNISEKDIVNIKDNQLVVLFEKGKVLDIGEEPGYYIVKKTIETNKNIDAKWKNLYIRNSENEQLCLIFLNLNLISNNKCILNNSIKYTDLKTKEIKRKHINMEVMYDFKIKEPANFLGKVIGLRNHFTKQELIERIRSLVLKYIEKGINEVLNEYKLDINTLANNFKNLEIRLKHNGNDKKLLEYGIEILDFNIKNFEVLNRKFKFF